MKRIETALCPYCMKPLFMSEVLGYTYQCPACEEDFYEFEARYENIKARDRSMEELWEQFRDIPVNPETERTEERFFEFPVDTYREDILAWFDERHSHGICYRMYRK